MEEETRAEVNELIDTIEDLGWGVKDYSAKSGGKIIQDGEAEMVEVSVEALKMAKQ